MTAKVEMVERVLGPVEYARMLAAAFPGARATKQRDGAVVTIPTEDTRPVERELENTLGFRQSRRGNIYTRDTERRGMVGAETRYGMGYESVVVRFFWQMMPEAVQERRWADEELRKRGGTLSIGDTVDTGDGEVIITDIRIQVGYRTETLVDYSWKDKTSGRRGKATTTPEGFTQAYLLQQG